MEDKKLTILDGFRFGIGLFLAKILIFTIFIVIIAIILSLNDSNLTIFTNNFFK